MDSFSLDLSSSVFPVMLESEIKASFQSDKSQIGKNISESNCDMSLCTLDEHLGPLTNLVSETPRSTSTLESPPSMHFLPSELDPLSFKKPEEVVESAHDGTPSSSNFETETSERSVHVHTSEVPLETLDRTFSPISSPNSFMHTSTSDVIQPTENSERLIEVVEVDGGSSSRNPIKSECHEPSSEFKIETQENLKEPWDSNFTDGEVIQPSLTFRANPLSHSIQLSQTETSTINIPTSKESLSSLKLVKAQSFSTPLSLP
ncbi:hypothetical protein HMI55_006657, partial [Coelomomyces lativittatus]